MPSDAPRPDDSDDQATVPGAVSRTLNSRSMPPGSAPVVGAAAKLQATAPEEGTLAEAPERVRTPPTQLWVWAFAGAVVALGLGALLLI